MWFKFRAAFGSCWSVLDCDVIIYNQGSVLSGFLNTRKLVKARDRRRSAFVLFFVVFLLNWFLKRVYFIISKIKNNNRKNVTHVFIFAFYYCIITCAYLPVSVMRCIFVLFQPEQVSHKLCGKTWSLCFWPSSMASCRKLCSNYSFNSIIHYNSF